VNFTPLHFDDKFCPFDPTTFLGTGVGGPGEEARITQAHNLCRQVDLRNSLHSLEEWCSTGSIQHFCVDVEKHVLFHPGLDGSRRSLQRSSPGGHLAGVLQYTVCSAAAQTKILITRSKLDGFTNGLVYHKRYQRRFRMLICLM